MAKKMKYNGHDQKILRGVASLFAENKCTHKFSDIEVKVGQRTFYCHKLVLQLNSDFFAQVSFTSRTITLQDIDPDQFYDVLQFMYTGEILLEKRHIQSILSVADFLNMDDLKKICFQYLTDTVDEDSFKFAPETRIGITAELELAWKSQVKFSQDLRKPNANLLSASQESMEKMLSSDDTDVESEEEVCDLLLRWFDVQIKAGNQVYRAQLLPLIRWSGISVEHVRNTLLANTTLISDPVCITFLSKVIAYLHSHIQFEGLRTFHRESTGFESCCVIFGQRDEGGQSQDVHRISLQRERSIQKWSRLPTNWDGTPCSCVVDKNNIYVIGLGVQPFRNETWRLDLLSHTWLKCRDMMRSRYSHCAAVVDSKLYVFGGVEVEGDESVVLSSGECYNTTKNNWSAAGNLKFAVLGAACVSYKNVIYVFGGLNKNDKAVNYVQMFNPMEPGRILLSIPMPSPQNMLQAVLFDTSVILLGRYTCFIYNFETKAWHERKQFKTNVDGFCAVLDNQSVYIAGGGTGRYDVNNKWISTNTDEVTRVSVLDIIRDEPASWKLHARLPISSEISACSLLTLQTMTGK